MSGTDTGEPIDLTAEQLAAHALRMCAIRMRFRLDAAAEHGRQTVGLGVPFAAEVTKAMERAAGLLWDDEAEGE